MPVPTFCYTNTMRRLQRSVSKYTIQHNTTVDVQLEANTLYVIRITDVNGRTISGDLKVSILNPGRATHQLRSYPLGIIISHQMIFKHINQGQPSVKMNTMIMAIIIEAYLQNTLRALIHQLQLYMTFVYFPNLYMRKTIIGPPLTLFCM